ncbi:MAG: MBL fold metallo-hydrolase RNA specificity domain-containing protein [archaeon]
MSSATIDLLILRVDIVPKGAIVVAAGLTFYGGVGEIGGNKILVEDQDTRILLDFGMSFGERRKFYSEPFNEEREIEFDKFKNWLDHFGLPMYHIHCSGHVMPNQLRRIILQIKPKKLFPIHTEHPDLFAKFMQDSAKIELPTLKRQHQLGED